VPWELFFSWRDAGTGSPSNGDDRAPNGAGLIASDQAGLSVGIDLNGYPTQGVRLATSPVMTRGLAFCSDEKLLPKLLPV